MSRLDGAERVFRHLTDLVEAVGDDLDRNLERGDTQIEDERLLASLRTTAKEIVSAATFGANPVFARPTVDTAPKAVQPALAAYRKASRPLDSLHEAPQVRQVLDETQQALTGNGGILAAIDRLDRQTAGDALPAIREALLSARENLRTTRESMLERSAEEPWMGPLDLAV